MALQRYLDGRAIRPSTKRKIERASGILSKVEQLHEAYLDFQRVFAAYLEAKEMKDLSSTREASEIYTDIALIRLPQAEQTFLTKLNELK